MNKLYQNTATFFVISHKYLLCTVELSNKLYCADTFLNTNGQLYALITDLLMQVKWPWNDYAIRLY